MCPRRVSVTRDAADTNEMRTVTWPDSRRTVWAMMVVQSAELVSKWTAAAAAEKEGVDTAEKEGAEKEGATAVEKDAGAGAAAVGKEETVDAHRTCSCDTRDFVSTPQDDGLRPLEVVSAQRSLWLAAMARRVAHGDGDAKYPHAFVDHYVHLIFVGDSAGRRGLTHEDSTLIRDAWGLRGDSRYKITSHLMAETAGATPLDFHAVCRMRRELHAEFPAANHSHVFIGARSHARAVWDIQRDGPSVHDTLVILIEPDAGPDEWSTHRDHFCAGLLLSTGKPAALPSDLSVPMEQLQLSAEEMNAVLTSHASWADTSAAEHVRQWLTLPLPQCGGRR